VAVDALDDAAKPIVDLLWASMRAKGAHV